MPATTYFANVIINHLLRNQAYTPPGTIYAALYTTSTDAAGGGTEATGGGYARVAITLSNSTVAATANTVAVGFTLPAGTYVDIAFHDASTAGNMLVRASLPSPLITAGGSESIPIGDLDFTVPT